MTTSTSDPTFRVGVIGCGSLGVGIGEQFLAEPSATVAALADISADARSEAGEVLGVPSSHHFEDYETMLEEVALDGVLVATPHALHHEQVGAALDAGLHVLCEKPLVLTVEDAVDLKERAAAADRTLMVGYQRHLDSAFVQARERYLDEDEADEPSSVADETQEEGDAATEAADATADADEPSGPPEIRYLTAEITQPWFDLAEKTWRADPDLSGGGFTVDTGRHVIDALLWVTGLEPVAVDAEMHFREPGLDEWAEIRIDFEGGARANVSLYGNAPAVRERHHVVDDAGAVEIDGLEWGGREVRTIDPGQTVHTPYLTRRVEQTKAEAFLGAVRSGEDPPATVDDAIRSTAVVEAAYESAESGERVEIEMPEESAS